MSTTRLLVVMFAIAILGGLTGAVVTLALADREEADGTPTSERGTVVRLNAESLFYDDLQMWCSDHHRFCIPRFDTPEDARAFYLGDTHDHFRNVGCFVDWRPDFDLSGFTLPPGEPEVGAFRGGCSGSTFLRDGTRIFGPSPRNLDEFPVTYHQRSETRDGQEFDTSYLEVDTRTLICGDWTADYPRDEVPDPECTLAPPYD